MKVIKYKRIISVLLCISIIVVSLPIISLVTALAGSVSANELVDIRNEVTIGENLYTHEVADGAFPSDWTRYEASWMWNAKSKTDNVFVSSGKTPAYVQLGNCDGSSANTTGAVVFPSVGTADYVLTVRMRIGNEYGNFGLITNLKDPSSEADGATISYVTLNKSGSVFAGNGLAVLANRWGNGSQVDEMKYECSKIATSANGGMVYPGAILTLKAYSYKGHTYFYINDELVSCGEQRNPEDVKSLCGVYCYNGKFQIYSVSIDAFTDSVILGPDEEEPDEEISDIRDQITIGENLYTHEVADGVFPSNWTRYEDSWLWNAKTQPGNVFVSSGKTPAYVVLNNTDSGHSNTSSAVVFPAVGTADYVLTVKMRIASEYGNYGLITNLKDPLSEADGGTISYVTLNKSGSVFAGNGLAVLANRWGNGSHVDEMNYEYSKIATSTTGGTIYPGATLTMKAYSVEGYTYFYINDELVSRGAQRNPEDVKSLCGVYCYNGKFQIYSVSIDSLTSVESDEETSDVIRDQLTIGENLYTHEVADGVFPSDWTRYEHSWLWKATSQTGNVKVSSGKSPAYVFLNNTDSGYNGTSSAVVFPSVGTADYVLTVKMRIASEYGNYGLITNLKDPLSEAEGGTISYVTLNKSGSVFAGNGSAVLANRWGNGSQVDEMNYEYPKIAPSADGGIIYPGAILTLKAYSIEGYTYFYINDELVSCGAQRNPEEVKSLCGVYCYNGKFQIYSVGIDELKLKNGTFNPNIPDIEKPDEDKPDEDKPDEETSDVIRDQLTIGENLYTHEVADGVFPSDWTRYEHSWLWKATSQTGNVKVSSGKSPAYVFLNNTDSGYNGTSGAVVFPSVGTADYVLTVKMRIASEYGNYGLITNLKDPLSEAEGGTISYVTLNKSGSVFAGNGSAVLANRWGRGSQVDEMNYEYSKIAPSADGGTIYPGAILTLKAYSIEGYTYFYIDDKFISCGKQRNPEDVKSLCGVYCYNGKFQIYSVSIDELKLKNGTFNPIIPEIPGNLVTTPEAPGDIPAVQKYGFVNYPWNSKEHKALKDNHIIEKGFSSDGDGYALKIDNTYSGASEAQQAIALPIEVKENTKYLISYDFYYEKIGDTSSAFSTLWFNTSMEGQPWVGTTLNVTNKDEYTPASVDEKKWITGYVYGTTAEGDGAHLVLLVNVPAGSIRYIDNIVVTEVPEGQCIAMFKAGSFQSPKPIVAKKNTTISIPDLKLDSKYVFLNWLLNNEDYTESTYLLENDTLFTVKTTVKTINDGFEDTYYGEDGLSSFGLDLDWEIYDSNGKDSANVNSGRYSLHRIGKDLRNGAYCFHHNTAITKYSLAVGKVYTISFWVKVENPVHKLGSIDIASCLSLCNPWDFSADEFNVAPISEIADGEWHKVTYTFMSSGEYLSIIVPGNLSIYIDDLTIEYTPDAERSKNCSFDEYVPAFLTADGKYVLPEAQSDELEKFQLVKRTEETILQEINNDNSYLIIIVIVSAVLVLAGGTTGAILFIRKRKYRG